METESAHTPTPNDRGQHDVYTTNYRGRVRSGCLTCRARKVKCDELQPTCNNCIRVKRSRVYKARKVQHGYHIPKEPSHNDSPGPTRIDAGDARQNPSPQSVEEQEDCQMIPPHENDETSGDPSTTPHNPFQYPDPLILGVTTRIRNAIRGYHGSEQRSHNAADSSTAGNSTSPATLISRDIELTTTIDILVT